MVDCSLVPVVGELLGVRDGTAVGEKEGLHDGTLLGSWRC